MCTLSEALDCDNEAVILEGFMGRYNVSMDEAKDIFTETKKWLWLASEKSVNGDKEPLFIDGPLLVIDEMWHNFILHTTHYYRYCLKKFNQVLHHVPTTPKEKQEYKIALKERREETQKAYAEQLNQQCDFIYEKLGEDTLVKWYETYADKYTPDHLKSIEKY